MNNRDWKKWFIAAGIRAVRTFAQSFVSMIGVGAALYEVDWKYVASCAAVSAILSLAMSLAGLPELDEETVKVQPTEDASPILPEDLTVEVKREDIE